ncbi:MAG: isoleucine--tRNA ligase [Cytophagales bacterium]
MADFPRYKNYDLTLIAKEVLEQWRTEKTFAKALALRAKAPKRTFYEGPPGLNGKPGIHHLFSRALKDTICRYLTMRGYHVERRAGWDTHGLPVELKVEQELGITKEGIGKDIATADYNACCKETVLQNRKTWDEMTKRIGFWVDLENPYMTCDAEYIDVVWGLVKRLYDKGYVYRSHRVQPYSPAAGTGLSTHELNQPGCYREVKDTTVVAQFAVEGADDTFLLAWTTTPWTLPANSALAVAAKMNYVKIKTYNRYTGLPIWVILAEASIGNYFRACDEGKVLQQFEDLAKALPWQVVARYKGCDLIGWRYVQLLPYVVPNRPAFRVVAADFIKAGEGTGIVHIAPTFGEDDFQLAQNEDIPSITVPDANGNPMPIVDQQGRYVSQITDFAGQYIKNEYHPQGQAGQAKSVDIALAIMLKKANKAFLVARYTHPYPHCWRTDKPILYYPLEAWFIRTKANKEDLLMQNETINWYPPATGEGRFKNWLAGVKDWNISRDRYWGTPLPIWSTQDGQTQKCIGSITALRKEVEKAVQAGLMASPLPADFDPHRPYVDEIILVGPAGEPMYREASVLDVWLDAGSMPYAQHGVLPSPTTPPKDFPAYFIAEGVDQTRGWFYTLHALSVLLYNKAAFQNVVSTGLVLDKEGRKMSKRLGNTIDPEKILDQYGPDVVRWYMMHHSDPWENLKFDVKGLSEVFRKFFDTLHHTYQFFALYANTTHFNPADTTLTKEGMTVDDRWIYAQLQETIETTTAAYEAFNPMKATRRLQKFVMDELSNWYVRLNRKRFWRGDDNADKQHVCTLLHHVLITIATLAAPIAPFYMERLYQDLTPPKQRRSIHLENFPKADTSARNTALERKMEKAQIICSLVHSLRKQHNIKVRQPLARILIPATEEKELAEVTTIILQEVNVKEITYVKDDQGLVHKQVKPNFRTLGRRYGTQIKEIQQQLASLSQPAIAKIEREGAYDFVLNGKSVSLPISDLEIATSDMPGWAVAREQGLTIALDLAQSPTLVEEGVARELVNRLQQHRKQLGFGLRDSAILTLSTTSSTLHDLVETHKTYIMSEVQITACHWKTNLLANNKMSFAWKADMLNYELQKAG